MWESFWSAIALVMVFEGVLPFLCPDCWRNTVRRFMDADTRSLRMIGAVSMFTGVILLFFVHRVIFNG